MFYQKNLPGVERAIRMALGLGMMGAGLLYAPEGWIQWSALAAGAMAACSGIVGFCPMCALAGRKL